MLHKPIDRSPDLKRLRDEGFEVSIRGTYVLVSGVPYLNSNRQVERGTLASELTVAGDKAGKPSNHVIHFIGEHPCNKDGLQINQLVHSTTKKNLGNELVVDRSFSHKPVAGYANYYEKFTTYIGVISGPVRSENYDITAQTYKYVASDQSESAFHYPDTNSSRAEINVISDKLKGQRILIIGMGGTGSYVLDFVAKTPVAEIHLYDEDQFLLHNAFRAPGAPDVNTVKQSPSKVDYFHGIYSRMHKGIKPHAEYVTAENLDKLVNFDYVFICVDKGLIKRKLVEFFSAHKMSFSDVGIGVVVADNHKLVGQVRVTSSFDGELGNVLQKGRICFSDGDEEDGYKQNIQIAELNALNAAHAVIKWKKYCGFYGQAEDERNSIYLIDDNSVINEDLNP